MERSGPKLRYGERVSEKEGEESRERSAEREAAERERSGERRSQNRFNAERLNLPLHVCSGRQSSGTVLYSSCELSH